MAEVTVDQLKELRIIEHEEMILEYVSQVPILRLPATTHAGILQQMKDEYNEKYFPEKGDKKPDE